MIKKLHQFAYVLACGDPKIRHELSRILDERFGPENYFWMPEFGGVKDIVSPEIPGDSVRLFRKMATAQKVHPFGLTVVINHSDCGAYRLAGKTFKDAMDEETHHRSELNKSVAWILERFPGAKVETHYFLKKEQKMAW